MDIKFCLRMESDPYADAEIGEAVQVAISEALSDHDCGMMDVPELDGEECWVFYRKLEPDATVASVQEWIRHVLNTIETHARRLSDGEWVVIFDRGSVFR